jgi:dienelactone hydrolase
MNNSPDQKVLDQLVGKVVGDVANAMGVFMAYLTAFENEMRVADVKDWQVIKYGNTLHAFTNPIAKASTMQGTLYSEQADRRSWQAVRTYLAELLHNNAAIAGAL